RRRDTRPADCRAGDPQGREQRSGPSRSRRLIRRSARHRTWRSGHEHGDLALVTLEGESDLLCREDQTARSVEKKVDRHVRSGEPDGAQDLFRILDVDVASDRKSQEAHRLLSVDHRDEPGLAPLLEAMESPVPAKLEHLLLVERDEELSKDEQPEEPREVEHRRSMLASPAMRRFVQFRTWRARAR